MGKATVRRPSPEPVDEIPALKVGKKKPDLGKNAPSACNVLGELDTAYRTWPEEVDNVLRHPASLEPKIHRGPRAKYAVDPDIKISGEHLVADSVEVRELREQLAAKKREMLKLQREQDLTESALRIAATEKGNFELLKIMSTPVEQRTLAQKRHVNKAVALSQSGPKRQYAATPSPMPKAPADSFEKHTKKRHVKPLVAQGQTIPPDSLPVMPSRDRPPRSSGTGYPLMSAFVARSAVAGRPRPVAPGDCNLGPLKRAVEEMAELAAKRRPPPTSKEVRFAPSSQRR